MGNIISFENVMKGAMTMPGVKVDRTAFLLSAFHPYGDVSGLVDAKPSDFFSKGVLDSVADNVIKNHTLKVTAISAAAGVPGGFAMLGAVPADIVQYYWHFLVLAQKLAYVYGWPDLRDENNNLGEGAQAILTMFIGVGLGVDGAANGVAIIARKSAEYWAKKLPTMALTKTAWYPILKRVLLNIGIKINKGSIGKVAGKVIPFLGGVVSGAMTYATFKPMSKKLKKELENTDLLKNLK